MKLEKPYYVSTGSLPGIDFNRELILPGTNETFPDGAVGVRVDDDFWAVAALPWDEYNQKPIEEIVREFWADYEHEAQFCPDSGTVEQKLYQYEKWAVNEENFRRTIEREYMKVKKERDRLKAERPNLVPTTTSRKETESSYFIRQYEHLLVAMAHEAVPFEHMRGVCSVCGLYGSDRVHSKDWIAKHNAGYEPGMKHLTDYEN